MCIQVCLVVDHVSESHSRESLEFVRRLLFFGTWSVVPPRDGETQALFDDLGREPIGERFGRQGDSDFRGFAQELAVLGRGHS